MTENDTSTGSCHFLLGVFSRQFLRRFWIFGGMLLMILSPGCNSSIAEKTVFYLMFHQVAESYEILPGRTAIIHVKDLQTGKQIPIYKTPLLTSGMIARAEVLRESPKNNKYGLRLFFNDTGMSRWRAMAAYNRADRVAVIMDGFLVGIITLPSFIRSEEYMDTPPLWNLAEAEAIAEHAESNFKEVNDMTILH